jgi:hypothetical protein
MSFRTSILSLAAVTVLGSSAIASPVNWATPAGSQPTFDYSAGQSVNGYWGDGVGLPNGFSMFPGGFNAEGSNDNNAQTSDTVSVILNAKPNHVFSRISAGLLGDWSILGGGNVGGSGELRVTNLTTLQTVSAPLTFDTLPHVTQSDAENKFSGLGEIILPAGWNDVKVEVDGLVSAYGSPNGTSFIEGKVGNIGVETAVVPLPAAILAAPAAIWVAARARRKMTAKRAAQ